ncbi:reprolysin-like metallopeptidase [Lewinella sp. JB7]|uniref:reprolysin-like metallopeptidase n=1 Tax=Lewinella sp. JB7 TaxID=2962887 RepID=UPI0020C99AB6|nr:M12 family metallo-peptidase [Lewinella sp. JB7]MCP9237323.1 M12 family metallo-peptidase [Lewinella sp. JB7]
MNKRLPTALWVATLLLGTGMLSAQFPVAKPAAERKPDPLAQLRTLRLVLPDGVTTDVLLQDMPVMEPGLAREKPAIHTYRIDNAEIRGAITLSAGKVYGDVLYRGQWLTVRRISSADKPLTLRAEAGPTDNNDAPTQRPCGAESLRSPAPVGGSAVTFRSGAASLRNGATKRTYRVAIVGTGEFYRGNGNNTTQATAAIVQTIAFANLIFENDLAVSLTLAGSKVYEDPATDPFRPDTEGGDQRVNQAAEVIAQNFDGETYDIGMVFHNTNGESSWTGGGVAYLGVVCDDVLLPDFDTGDLPNEPDGKDGPYKAGAWSGAYDNTYIGWKRLVTHELAHMFGGSHTFNGSGGGCTNNIADNSAVEIGSGTTLLSYADLCNTEQNIAYDPETSSYFHQYSIDQMLDYLERQACGQEVSSGNTPPVVTANPCGNTTTIPKGTPFLLRGEATDADEDLLTYSWEQIDDDGVGAPSQGATLTQPGSDALTAGESTVAPLFRSRPASDEAVRYFPEGADGQPTEFEVLPEVARSMTFALTVRDNHPGAGGIASESVEITVADSGPLTFAGPTATGDLSAGSSYTFTWETNGSDNLCDQVAIEMALNDSQQYLYSLGTVSYAAKTATLQIPPGVPATDRLRFRLICSDQPCQTFYAVDTQLRTLTNESCAASPSNVYPAETIFAGVGSAEAQLDMNQVGGHDFTFPVSGALTGESPLSAYAYRSVIRQRDECMQVEAPVPVESYTLIPSRSGTFQFKLSDAEFGLGFTLFENNFDAANGCATFLQSTFSNGILHSDITVEMIAGRTYVLIVSTYDDTAPTRDEFNVFKYKVSVSMEPEGNQWSVPFASTEEYAYSYLAVGQEDKRIRAVSARADFSLLSAGEYRVYGVNHSADAATDAWVGQPFSSITDGSADGQCLQLSDNSRRLSFYGAQAVVPVEWLSFTGAATADGIDLEWTVADQRQNDYFEVQGSRDGRVWRKLGQVTGAGNRISEATYTFLDTDPLDGSNLYRLRQVDFDGTSELSTVVSVDWRRPVAAMVLFPNPFGDEFEVRSPEARTERPALYDLHGRDLTAMLRFDRSSTLLRVDAAALPAGLYLLRWGEETLRVVKR